MDQEEKDDREGGLKGKISGFGQEVIGEIERIGGALTGDPLTQAEGEFNAEVGEIRQELEEDETPDDPPDLRV